MAVPHGNDLVAVAHGLRTGSLDLPAYLEELGARIRRVDPVLQALLPEDGRLERLLREAGALLARYPEPASRPPLFGVSVGVKDIFHVVGFLTRAGSLLPVELLQGPEAECVTALKAAGALLLGKTVTTEFAFFAPGPTRNPCNPEHTPGGSSSGSAAAVAAGFCPLALGTQTIGSLIRPAAFCGVVAFKPSYGRISCAGVVPLAPSLDHVGFLTTDVAGANLAASVLCREWRPVDEVRNLPVLGVPEGPYLNRTSPEGLARFRATCHRLVESDYRVESVPALSDFAAIVERHYRIVAAEAARVHQEWFDRYRDRYHPETARLIERGRQVSSAELGRALAGRVELRDELSTAMDAHGLDLWITPAAVGPAPPGLERTGDPVMNLPWTYCGMPAVGIPAGVAATGLPLGLQIVGRWRADEELLAWAERIEQVVRVDVGEDAGGNAFPGAR